MLSVNKIYWVSSNAYVDRLYVINQREAIYLLIESVSMLAMLLLLRNPNNNLIIGSWAPSNLPATRF